MKYLPSSLVIAAGLALGMGSAWAQSELHDPTRPPVNLSANANVSTVTTTTPDNVQMLLVGRQRSFAMIDGVMVKPGDMFNQWQLISIGRESVVMRNASVTEEISLNPLVVKTRRSP
jgi:hypothetical protein